MLQNILEDNYLNNAGTYVCTYIYIYLSFDSKQNNARIRQMPTSTQLDYCVCCISKDVSIPEIAAKTKNFSGAELDGLLRSATSFESWQQWGRSVRLRSHKSDSILNSHSFLSRDNVQELCPPFRLCLRQWTGRSASLTSASKKGTFVSARQILRWPSQKSNLPLASIQMISRSAFPLAFSSFLTNAHTHWNRAKALSSKLEVLRTHHWWVCCCMGQKPVARRPFQHIWHRDPTTRLCGGFVVTNSWDIQSRPKLLLLRRSLTTPTEVT